MLDFVARWTRKARANPIIAALIVSFAVLSAFVVFGNNVRTLFTTRGTLELVDVVAVNDRDSVAAFRRTWLGDTMKPQPSEPQVPSSPPKPTFRDVSGSLVILTRPTDTARFRFPTIPRGTGRFPIIDIKLRNTAVSPAFLSKLEVVQTRRGPFEPTNMACSTIGPSWEYNILLDGSKASDRRTFDLSQAVDANGLDRFVVIVAQWRNAADARYDLDLTLVYNDGRRLRLGTVTVKPGPTECTEIHQLPSVHHIPATP